MNFGPRKMQISIAAIPAIRTSPIEQIPPARSATRLEPGRARALDEDDVAALELGGEELRRLAGIAHQLVGAVVAGRPADSDDQVDPQPASVLADLAVVPGRVGAELGHLAEDGDPAPALEACPDGPGRPASRPGLRCSSRSRGRSRRPARGARPGSARSLCSQRGRPSRRAGRRAPRRRRSRPSRWSGCGPRRTGSGTSRDPSGVEIIASVTPSTTRLRSASTSPPGPNAAAPEQRQGAARARRPRPARPPSPARGRSWRSSALAAAIASTEPSSSTWTGPTLVITATSGSAIAASSAIWPAPRIAISSTRTSASGRASSTVSGSPISVLRFSRLAWTRPGKQGPGDVLHRGLAHRPGDADDPRAERAPPLAGQRPERRQRILHREHPGPPSVDVVVRSATEAKRGTAAGPTTTPQAPAAIAAGANSPPSKRSPRRPKKRSPSSPAPESIVARAGEPGRPCGEHLGAERRRDPVGVEVHRAAAAEPQ